MEINSHPASKIIEAAKEASAWCQLRWDNSQPRASLRTLEFSPYFFGTDHFHTVNSILYSRKYKMNEMGIKPSPNLSLGEILIYEPDCNIFDGLSEHETHGYLDVNDCPPWDTWIGYINSNGHTYVLSWVPSELVSLVNAGFEVNCVECFYWLKNSNEAWALELLNA